MGQFLAPKGQILPSTIADVKSRLRRVEHKIEAINSAGTDTGGVEITFSDTLPDSANVGDIWYETSDSSVIGQYQCITAYTSGNGSTSDWTDYTTDGSSITAGTVANAQLATDSVSSDNIQDAAVTLAAVDTTDVTARALGSNIVTIGNTQPTSGITGDTWIQTDSSNDITAIWTYDASTETWTESTIAISTSGGVEITASTTAPTSPNVNDLWINESEDNVLEQWDGTEWNAYQVGTGAMQAGSVTSTVLGNSSVTPGSLSEGSLDGSVINAPVINGGVINASEFVLEPGSGSYIAAYTTGTGTTITTFTKTGTGTWTCPPGVTSVQIECWGAGGGGAGGATNNAWTSAIGGGGGGGGGYSTSTLTVVPGTTYTFSVGAAGSGGIGVVENPSATAESGTAGGNTTFTVGSTSVVAGGGGGAAGSSNGTSASVGGSGGGGGGVDQGTTKYSGGAGAASAHPGGAGGGSSAGSGANGAPGYSVSSTYGSASGTGGTAPAYGGNGGNGGTSTASTVNGGAAGTFPGGGGGGGAAYVGSGGSTASSTAGGNGANGYIKLTYTPASGTVSQLAASISPTNIDDSAGNSLKNGVSTYAAEGAFTQMATDPSSYTPYLIFGPPGFTSGSWPQMYAGTNAQGDVNASYNLTITGGITSGHSGTYIETSTDAADGSAVGSITTGIFGESSETFMVQNIDGILCYVPIRAIQPSTSNIETWHTVTPSGSWTVNASLQYKLYPDNTVAIRGELTTTATIAYGATLFTLPTGYQPASGARIPINYNTGSTSFTPALMTVATSGAVQTYEAITSGNTLNINVRFPLD